MLKFSSDRAVVGLMRRVLAPLAVLLAFAAAGPAPAATAPNNVVGGSPRVVGGSPATGTDAPWRVLVLPDGYLCGGAILDATHVVTAAHCVYDEENQEVLVPATITVRAGVTNRFATGQHPTVTAVSVYPGYDPDMQTGDVAILTLATPFSFSATVQVIALTDVGYRPEPGDGTAPQRLGLRRRPRTERHHAAARGRQPQRGHPPPEHRLRHGLRAV